MADQPADGTHAPLLILASSSPRRYQILSLLQIPFLIIPPESAEQWTARSPHDDALHLAARKAAAVAGRFREAVVIGSDTLINLDDVKIGKPRDAREARQILERLRGRPHHVITAVVIMQAASGGTFDRLESVRVTMRPYSESELVAYLEAGESLDKAGAYSLQHGGRKLIEQLDGDYLAAVGLPLRAVAEGLRAMGVPVPVDVDKIYRERSFLNWRTFAA